MNEAMRIVRCLLVYSIIALTGCSSKAQVAPVAPPKGFTFIHCSDVHVGAGNNHETDAALFAEIAKLDPKPAFVVATGDICEYGTDEQYALYRETLNNLGDVKMYPAPGNHDVRWNPRGKEGYTLGTGGPLYRSWDYDGVHFVTLDSTVLLEHWGHISQEQLNWLKKDLAKIGREKPVIIGFHHWIGRESVQTDSEQALMDLVKPYNVVLWLQGHGHADIDWNVNGVPATMVKGLYQNSYDIIQVTPDELRIRKRTLPDPKKKSSDELVREKTAPADKIQPVVKPLMNIPLKKQPVPNIVADAKLEDDQIVIDATAPHGATLEYRVDTAHPQPLSGLARIPTTQLVPGEHVITVQASFPDKRAYQKPLPVTIPGAVSQLWQTDVGGEVQSPLVKHGDTIYVSSMGNDLIALRDSDGKEKWRVKTAGPIFQASHFDDASNTLYFGSADHFVYAVNPNNGHVKWKAELGGAVLAGPNVAQGVLSVGTTDTKIYGIDASNGNKLWTVQGKNMFQSKTATDGQRFFVGGWDNFFRCIDAKSGQEIWSKELGRKQNYKNFSAFSPAITSPAVGDGKVFVSTNDGILHGLKIENGDEVWRVDWKKMGYSSPLYRDGRVYAALSDEGKAFCVDANTGEFKWTAETGAVIYDSSFCFGGGNVFIANVNGTINSINADSGKIEWQYRMPPGHLLGSPVADDDRVYMGSMNGLMIALPIHASRQAESAVGN